MLAHGGTRQLLDPRQSVLVDALAGARAALIADVQNSLTRAVHAWVRRETDLMAAMRDRHGRLAARFVQRALFDRRGERLAAAQQTLLDEALSQSAERLTELRSYERPAIEACDLVFAVFLG
jgi:hypothetical protein